MNELSHVSKEEFASNLLDNATKKPRGLVIVATNAGFVGSWQEKWREVARNSDRWHFHSYCQPAPWLSDDEVEEGKRRNSNARFQRLFWGVWPNQNGDALDAADIKACINPALKPGSRLNSDDEFFVSGLDLGVKQDHSALIVVAGYRQTLQLRLVVAKSWKPDPVIGKVDLMDVERTVADTHHTYELLACGYDPYQAALMAQRLEHQGVPMKEMTFNGANLNLMASTMLDIFRSRRLEMFPHPALITDLGRLMIVEKSYGYKLEAVRNESGHADLAIALSIALPVTVDEAAWQPRVGVAWSEHFVPDMRSSYEQFVSAQAQHAQEVRELSQRNPSEERRRLASEAISQAYRSGQFFNNF